MTVANYSAAELMYSYKTDWCSAQTHLDVAFFPLYLKKITGQNQFTMFMLSWDFVVDHVEISFLLLIFCFLMLPKLFFVSFSKNYMIAISLMFWSICFNGSDKMRWFLLNAKCLNLAIKMLLTTLMMVVLFQINI